MDGTRSLGQYRTSTSSSSSSSLVSVMSAASLHHCRPRGRPPRSLLRRENSGRRDEELEGGMDGCRGGSEGRKEGLFSPQGLQRQRSYQSLDGRRA